MTLRMTPPHPCFLVLHHWCRGLPLQEPGNQIQAGSHAECSTKALAPPAVVAPPLTEMHSLQCSDKGNAWSQKQSPPPKKAKRERSGDIERVYPGAALPQQGMGHWKELQAGVNLGEMHSVVGCFRNTPRRGTDFLFSFSPQHKNPSIARTQYFPIKHRACWFLCTHKTYMNMKTRQR